MNLYAVTLDDGRTFYERAHTSGGALRAALVTLQEQGGARDPDCAACKLLPFAACDYHARPTARPIDVVYLEEPPLFELEPTNTEGALFA